MSSDISSDDFEVPSPSDIGRCREHYIENQIEKQKRHREAVEAARAIMKQREEAKKRRKLTKSIDQSLSYHVSKVARKLQSEKTFKNYRGDFIELNKIFCVYKPGLVTESMAADIAQVYQARGWRSWIRNVDNEGWWIFINYPL